MTTKRLHLLLPLLALLAFFPVLWSGLIWDDAIIYRDQLPKFTSLASAFYPPPGVQFFTTAYYRPAVLLTYLLDYNLASPLGFSFTTPGAAQPIPHGLTLLGHALASWLVGLLALRLLRGSPHAVWGALAAGALFALHPAHGDSVCLISGRTDVFATVFVLAAALFLLRWRDGGGHWLLAAGALSFFAGLLFKEVTVTALAILPAAWALFPADPDPARRPRPWKPALAWGAALAALALGVYALLRYTSGWWLRRPFSMFDEDILPRLLSTTGFYFWKTFAPWPRHFFVLEVFPSAGTGAAIVAATLALAGLAAWKWREGRRVLALAGIWYFAALSPVLYVAVRSVASAPIAERYLYLPSAGVCLLAGVAVAHLARREALRKPLAAVLGLMLAAFLAANYVTIPVWADEMRFWKTVTSQPCSDDHALGWVNLAELTRQRGDLEAARVDFEKALSDGMISNLVQMRLALHGLGTTNMELALQDLQEGRRAEAVIHARRAVAVLEPIPLRGINQPLGTKLLGLAYATSARATAAMGGRDDNALNLAESTLIEAARNNLSDAEVLDTLQMVRLMKATP